MIKYPTMKLTDKDFPLGVYNTLRLSGGYFVGNIHLEPIELPHMGLSNNINSQGKSIDEFNRLVVNDDLGTYALHMNQPMLLISKLWAVPRPATLDEIYHDADNFGEQVWCSKEFYAERAGITLEEVEKEPNQKFKFPEGSWLGGEEFIYMGPVRVSEYIFSTFIDQYPNRVDMAEIEKIIEGMKPEGDIYEGTLAEGGFVVALSEYGVTSPLKYVRQNSFGGKDEVLPTKFEQITLAPLYDGLKNYIAMNKESLDAQNAETLMHHKRERPDLFNGRFEDGSMSSWYNFDA
ncbi:hypothetical protein JXA48_04540 [Candidatus Woesearchaeota archaeon]|nr:hypothetical protein [Candidatus Woesearchaeota archaeon]